MKKIGIVVNPISGGFERKEELISSLLTEVASVFPEARIEVAFSERVGHATELAAGFAIAGADLCLAVGGDGTMSEVATGLISSECPLGIIPLGSGNGLARHIGISLDPIQALHQSLNGKTRVMDAMEVNGKFAFLNFGFGLEAEVAHAFARSGKRGFAQYVKSAWAEFRQWKGLQVELETDGFSYTGLLYNVNFANGSQYGNSAVIAPAASVCDGLIDASLILPFPFWYGLVLSIRLFRGRLRASAYFKPWRCTQILVRFDCPLSFQIDGEPMPPVREIKARIRPTALGIRVPESVHSI